jgi:putative phosphoribosyl transferase
MTHPPQTRSSVLRSSDLELHRNLIAPADPIGVVLLAHVDDPATDRGVVDALQGNGVATVAIDRVDAAGHPGAADDADDLATRIAETIDWLRRDPVLCELPLGLFGAGRAAPAALMAAARRADAVAAVVCVGGYADLAGDELARVHAPALFLVPSHDADGVALYRAVMPRLGRAPTLSLICAPRGDVAGIRAAGDTIRLATEWFTRHFTAQPTPSRRGLGDRDC